MTLQSEDPSVHESKIKLRTAYVTLLGVFFGVVLTGYQIYSQNQNLQRIAQNFENLSHLKKALMMPLEGEWEYEAEYTKYFGLDSFHYSHGKAIFIGKDDDRTRVGYLVYLGAGVFEDRNGEPIVTLFGYFFLDTDKAGIPSENCSADFHYIARTTSNPVFAKPGKILLTECKLDVSRMRTITKISFAFHAHVDDRRTDATATFTRIP